MMRTLSALALLATAYAVPDISDTTAGQQQEDAAQPPPPSPSAGDNHLWFRSFTTDSGTDSGCTEGLCLQCGEVDAGPHMPAELFKFRDAQGQLYGPLQRYVDVTVELYRVDSEVSGEPCSKATDCKTGFCDKYGNCEEEVRVELGRCADKNYTQELHPESNVPWAPTRFLPGRESNNTGRNMMDEVCQRKCKCNYLSQNKTVPHLPECSDKVDDPDTGVFCSLCGPKYNKNVVIALFGCKSGDNKCPGPEPRAPEGSGAKGSVGLVPFLNCTKLGRNVCYQGTEAEVARVVKLDPFACKPGLEARLVPYQWYDTDPCYDSGFGELLGHDPIFPKVELWGCGDTCGRADKNDECEVLQGTTQGIGSYCVGPERRFDDGTRRNHTIVTCQGNPGGLASGFLGLCQLGEYCGKGTGAPANASQCFPA